MNKKSIIIIARNEKDWPRKTAENFRNHFPEADIIGVDDGGENEWPSFVDVIKTKGGVGVGNCKRIGIENTDADLLLISDAHVLYYEGDIERAWSLCSKGYIVNSTTKSITTGRNHGNGRAHFLPSHKTKNVSTEEGVEVGMVGGVYFMRRDVAKDIIAPTSSHGFFEQIMTCAAFTLNHRIFALPSFTFSHLYKKKFNYPLTYSQQQQNKLLLDYWFFDGIQPKEISLEQKKYKEFIESSRKITSKQLIDKIETMNNRLLSQ